MEKSEQNGLLRALRIGEAYASIQENLHAAINLKSWALCGVMPIKIIRPFYLGGSTVQIGQMRDAATPNIERVGKGHSKYPAQWKKWAS